MRLDRKKVAWSLLLIGAALLVAGSRVEREICTKDSMKRRVKKTEAVSEFQLTEDATFSGVERIKGLLYTNYDRSAGMTKKACPT